MKWVADSVICYSDFLDCDLKVNCVYLNFNLPLNIEIPETAMGRGAFHLFLFYNPLLDEFTSWLFLRSI